MDRISPSLRSSVKSGPRKCLIVIDSNALIHRAYHALPPLTTKKGELVNATYGFLLAFLKAIKEFQPDYIAACFDFPAPTFRHKKFKEYKKKRPPAPEELYQQIPRVKEILKRFNVPIFEKEGFEADDLLGAISRLAQKKSRTRAKLGTGLIPHRNKVSGAGQILPEIETIILSGDLDTLQLINPRTKVYCLSRGLKEAILYNEEKVKEKYGGLSPSQLVDFKALKGDPSDNVPGVSGVGGKTAISLIKEFHSLENLYQNLEQKTEEAKKIKPKLKESLLQLKEQAFFSKDLVQIKTNLPLDFNLKKCRWKEYNKEKVIQNFKNLEFYSLIKKLPEAKKQEKKEVIGENLKLW
jgi:DNA polymerase-1